MTKKNAKKLAARARQAANGGNYQHHLRTVGGLNDAPKPPGFFEAIMEAVGRMYPDAALTFEDRFKRLTVKIGTHTMAFVTPYNAEPEWPVMAWNETPPQVPHRAWNCEGLDDIITVLRWPAVVPSKARTSVNELRDDHENPSRHSWVRLDGNYVWSSYECRGCKLRLRVQTHGETPEEVAHMGHENWRRREAGTFAQNPGAITRSMQVGFIPPKCPTPAHPAAVKPVPHSLWKMERVSVSGRIVQHWELESARVILSVTEPFEPPVVTPADLEWAWHLRIDGRKVRSDILTGVSTAQEALPAAEAAAREFARHVGQRAVVEELFSAP